MPTNVHADDALQIRQQAQENATTSIPQGRTSQAPLCTLVLI